MKVFLICPVRSVSPEETADIKVYVEYLEASGDAVYWPARDTNQVGDSTGVRICTDNRRALSEADEVHVWWNIESYGSHFDLGMAWALNKPVVSANEISPTANKSYSNFIRAIRYGYAR